MSDVQVSGSATAEAPMIHRRQLLNRIWGVLTQRSPSNVSMIGPRSIGKSVLMNALAELAATAPNSPYSLVVYWHLGHVCPTTDDAFVGGFSQKVREAMGAEYADLRNYLCDDSYSRLKEVTDLLDADGKRILILWDGFDKPLEQRLLSGHLWDQMRDIVNGKVHKIVTATRAPLIDLIRNEDAITSPFWNIFEDIHVGPFEEAELRLAVEQSGVAMTSGGVTELGNWTANHPLLLMTLLKRFMASSNHGTIDNHGVNAAAAAAVEEFASILKSLWKECPADAQEVFRLLVEHGELETEGVGRTEAACLTARGFAIKTGNKLKPGCRLLQAHLQQFMPDAGSLTRLFGTWESYQAQIRSLLELRLKQIRVVDNRLHTLVRQSIGNIPDLPDDCLNHLNNIGIRALNLILDHEFGASRQVPRDLLEYWKDNGCHQDKPVMVLAGRPNHGIPPDPYLQCGILQLLTGSRQGLESKAKSISKDTYALVNAIHSFRNRNVHPEGQSMHVGVAVAAMMTCLELLDCLARELA